MMTKPFHNSPIPFLFPVFPAKLAAGGEWERKQFVRGKDVMIEKFTLTYVLVHTEHTCPSLLPFLWITTNIFNINPADKKTFSGWYKSFGVAGAHQPAFI